MSDETPTRKRAAGLAAWLEPGDPVPVNIPKWLAEWGFDPVKGYDTYQDAQGWTWFVEKRPPEDAA